MRIPSFEPARTHGGRSSPRTRGKCEGRGQIGPLGVVLIVGIVVIGSISVAVIGSQAIASTQHHAEIARAQMALSQLDSQTAQVALGSSDVQTIELGSSGHGQYQVDGNAGHIWVIHHFANKPDQPIYNGSLGAVLYTNGETTIAYQGGGIWRTDGNEDSVMISPPEFHYQNETLVLPVIGVSGSDSGSGDRRAVVTNGSTTVRRYPDATQDFVNPVHGGTILLTIQSDYYKAWGRYLESRTDGAVEYDDASHKVTVTLTAPLGFLGQFTLPPNGQNISIRGIGSGHDLQTFRVNMLTDFNDNANQNNLKWSLWTTKGNSSFEIFFERQGGASTTPCKDLTVSASIYYSADQGDTYQGWYSPSAFATTCTHDASDNVTHVEANLTGSAVMNLTALANNELGHFTPSTAQTQVTLTQHPDAGEPKSYSIANGSTENIGFLMDHYFALLGPDFNLTVADWSSDTVDENNSTAYLMYPSHGRVTYLHVSSKTVHVKLT